MTDFDQSCWVFDKIAGCFFFTQQLKMGTKNLEDGIKQEFMGILEIFPLKR